MEKIRWGIMGPGAIAHPFVEGLLTIENAELVAVGSRDKQRANSFASQYHIPRAYGSYEELVKDAEIDIIYIATPHAFHKEGAMMCLNAGKAVLCEKSFTLNAKDARDVVALARKKNLFLMEAMWTRYLPAIVKVREWLKKGMIGDILCFKGDFGFRGNGDPNSRLLNLKLGGGALLDVGIYPVSFASMVFGKQPEKITSLAHIGPTGADEQCALLFGYENGKIASLIAAVETDLVNDAWIFGTEGSIHIPDFFYAKGARVQLKNGYHEEFGPDFDSTGYQYEAREAMSCMIKGLKESPVMPLDETVAIMETMDTLRSQWQLKYPGEE